MNAHRQMDMIGQKRDLQQRETQLYLEGGPSFGHHARFVHSKDPAAPHDRQNQMKLKECKRVLGSHLTFDLGRRNKLLHEYRWQDPISVAVMLALSA